MTSRRKRERLTPEARRAQLIALGVEMLTTRTLEQLSVEELAAEAGISRGLLFHYFASKQDFYVAVVREQCHEMLRRTAPSEDVSDPLAELRGSLAAYVDYVLENPDGYVVLVRGAGTSDPAIRAVIDETKGEMARRFAEHLRLMGVTVTSRAEVALHGWFAYVEECTVRWLSSRSFSRDDLLDMLAAAAPALVSSADLGAVTAGFGS